jgi:hypothetical protein
LESEVFGNRVKQDMQSADDMRANALGGASATTPV